MQREEAARAGRGRGSCDRERGRGGRRAGRRAPASKKSDGPIHEVVGLPMRIHLARSRRRGPRGQEVEVSRVVALAGTGRCIPLKTPSSGLRTAAHPRSAAMIAVGRARGRIVDDEVVVRRGIFRLWSLTWSRSSASSSRASALGGRCPWESLSVALEAGVLLQLATVPGLWGDRRLARSADECLMPPDRRDDLLEAMADFSVPLGGRTVRAYDNQRIEDRPFFTLIFIFLCQGDRRRGEDEHPHARSGGACESSASAWMKSCAARVIVCRLGKSGTVWAG